MTAEMITRQARRTKGLSHVLTEVIGSGIIAERRAGGSVGLALLANAIVVVALPLLRRWNADPA
jgi:hypothetical protein